MTPMLMALGSGLVLGSMMGALDICVEEDLTTGHPELAPRLACSATRATTCPRV